jgi:rhomboid-like protein
MQRPPQIILNLIIINALACFAVNVFGESVEYGELIGSLALYPVTTRFFSPYQLVTYMFLHADIFHLLFNMLGLWMFGSVMEKMWGAKRFIIFYFACGIIAGVAQMFLGAGPSIGASGAIMGVLVAFGMTFPNTELFIMPIPFPVKAKWAISGFIAIDLLSGLADASNDPIAHFAHLGGALAGFLIMLLWKNNKKHY